MSIRVKVVRWTYLTFVVYITDGLPILLVTCADIFLEYLQVILFNKMNAIDESIVITI